MLNQSKMRQRQSRSTMTGQSLEELELEERGRPTDTASIISSSKDKESIHALPTYVAFLTIAVLALLFTGVYFLDKSVPSAYTISDEKDYPDAFIAERAQVILKGLTDIGPKVVGSKANEVEAVKYLEDEIDKIIKEAHGSFTVTKDKQIVSGAYYLGFLPNGLINSYAKVQNLVVKISGKNSNESILINSHFDSVPTSPGASDDGIMVAVMLETIRKLTQTQREYERNIIFLFNGAEEAPLQAAHGFITQHKWAKSCKTIINLDAAGHGGRAILFQSGPTSSPDLISHYASVPYPYAQAAGEEIFQSNIIPSDTDFRLFRDFGGMSGFDFAFAQNGYRYHTKYDNFRDLPIGSYQHVGGNLLALVRSLAEDAGTMDDKDADKVVYFDVFNWFLISYSMVVAISVNIVVALVSLIVAVLSARNLQLGLNIRSCLYLLYATLAILGSWILAAGVALLTGVIVDATYTTMSWYGQPYILFFLYVAPILGSFTGIMWIFNRFENHNGKNLATQSQIQMHINRLIWSVILFVGTLLKLRSVYVILVPVLFNTIASLVIFVLKWQHSVRKWVICALICTIPPTIMSMYVSVEIYSLFIPITGRIGANRNPELIIGLLTVLMCLLILSHYTSFVVLVQRHAILPLFLLVVFLITLIVVVASGAFPYSGDDQAPAPQRFMIFHTNRIHHDAKGNTHEQSGIFILNNDRNSPHSVKHTIGLGFYNISADCEKYPACGMPISSARMVATVEASSWKPFHKAVINEQTKMSFTTTTLSQDEKQYSFEVEGPDHLTVFIRPISGTTILRTSLHEIHTDELVFINHVYGKEKTNLKFTVDVMAADISVPLMDFVVSGKYYNLDGQEHIIKEFDDFIQKFPDWADVSPALANYESYVI